MIKIEQAFKQEVEIETGRLLFLKNCDFLISASSIDQFPESQLSEIAFAGRSNVGKSSLLNALTNRKNLARTSNTPGRTQQINFFELDKKIMLVDLPGYGYARTAKSVVDKWSQLVKDYLKGRVQLRRVCLLIDSRHGLKVTDFNTMALMDNAAVNYQIILTKCDKVKKSHIENLLQKTYGEIEKRTAAHPKILVTSSSKLQGITHVRSSLATLATKQ